VDDEANDDSMHLLLLLFTHNEIGSHWPSVSLSYVFLLYRVYHASRGIDSITLCLILELLRVAQQFIVKLRIELLQKHLQSGRLSSTERQRS
jgi:hypothetical protein